MKFNYSQRSLLLYIEADLEDKLNYVNLKDEDAFNGVYPNVKKLTIDQSTKKKMPLKK